MKCGLISYKEVRFNIKRNVSTLLEKLKKQFKMLSLCVVKIFIVVNAFKKFIFIYFFSCVFLSLSLSLFNLLRSVNHDVCKQLTTVAKQSLRQSGIQIANEYKCKLQSENISIFFCSIFRCLEILSRHN